MINIALLSHDGYIGGAEKMIFVFAEVLAKSKKYRPILFFPMTDKNIWVEEAKKKGLDAIATPTIPLYMSSINDNKVIETVEKYSTLFEEYDIELVVVNTFTNVVGSLAAYRCHLPIVLWCHGLIDGGLLNQYDFDNNRNLLMDRLCIALSDTVLFCSKWVHDFYKTYCGDKGDIFYNWTSIPQDYHRDNTQEFVCLNTLEANKGIMVALKAVNEVAKQRNDFTFVFYGDSNAYKKEALKYIESNNLSSLVQFRRKQTDVSEIYTKAKCLVQPSFVESFGLTVIEAMSYGIPVIVAKNGGSEEIIDESAGIIIDAGDYKALAEAMNYILDNPEACEKMGKNGFEIVNQRFTDKTVLDHAEKILDKTFKKFEERTIDKCLINDCLSYIYNNIYNTCGYRKKSRRIVHSDMLILSNLIKEYKVYRIKCIEDTFTQISMIFTSFDNSSVKGTVIVQLYDGNNKIAESQVGYQDIEYNEWCDFKFDNFISGYKDKYLTVKILFKNDGVEKLFGVYENKQNRVWAHRFLKWFIKEESEDVLFFDLR